MPLRYIRASNRARQPLDPADVLSISINRNTKAMEHKNQIPNLSPKAKAARRRSVIWSIILFLVVLGCIAITIVPRYYR
jgi:hypothetical protein